MFLVFKIDFAYLAQPRGFGLSHKQVNHKVRKEGTKNTEVLVIDYQFFANFVPS